MGGSELAPADACPGEGASRPHRTEQRLREAAEQYLSQGPNPSNIGTGFGLNMCANPEAACNGSRFWATTPTTALLRPLLRVSVLRNRRFHCIVAVWRLVPV